MKLTSRERFEMTLRRQSVDKPFVRTGIGGWAETRQRWEKEGWDGRPLDEVFGTDSIRRVDVYYGPAPSFEYRVVEEDAETRIYVNHEGILMREFKSNPDSSMPGFIRFPVETEADFDAFAAERLQLSFPLRQPADWPARLAEAETRQHPRNCWADRWGGFFGPLRNLMGLENLCVALYDQPRLVEKMMAQRADAIIAITEETMKHTGFEMFEFWEDMAYIGGSLIDPAMFRRLALPHYRRVCDWLRSQGVEFIALDSDGNTWELIPIWLDAGINVLWPFEVQSGMDVLEVRRRFGRDLVIWGGIDKRAVAAGGAVMRREVDRVMPLVEQGGYIPEMDHAAPPDISWANMSEFVPYLLHRLGRG